MGADLSVEIEEAKVLATKFLVIFTNHYQRLYVISVATAAMKAQEKALATSTSVRPKWQLLKCKKLVLPTHIAKTGALTKLSKHLKKWNPRWFVVRSDHVLEYYDTEERAANRDKRLGELNLSNWKVYRDANDSTQLRMQALSQCFHVPFSAISQGDKYPSCTIELYHPTHGSIFIGAGTEDNLRSWWPHFDEARAVGPRFNHSEDTMHCIAFTAAILQTRRYYEVHSLWHSGGGEAMQIIDAINEVISVAVLPKCDEKIAKISGWNDKVKARQTFVHDVDKSITEHAILSWKRLYETVKKNRVKYETDFKSVFDDVFQQRRRIKAEMRTVLRPKALALIQRVRPHLMTVAAGIFPDVRSAFSMLTHAFDATLNKAKQFHEQWARANNTTRMYLVSQHAFPAEFLAAEQVITKIYFVFAQTPTHVLSGVEGWHALETARQRLRRVFQNALFTFENVLIDGLSIGRSWDAAAAEVRAMLLKDCQSGAFSAAVRILVSMLQCTYQEEVVRPSRDAADDLYDELHPDIQKWLDPTVLVDEVLKEIVKEECAAVVRGDPMGGTEEPLASGGAAGVAPTPPVPASVLPVPPPPAATAASPVATVTSPLPASGSAAPTVLGSTVGSSGTALRGVVAVKGFVKGTPFGFTTATAYDDFAQ